MKRFVHGVFLYVCQKCNDSKLLWLEKGIEEQCNPDLKHPSGRPHKPTPFMISCPNCKTGMMIHTGTNWLADWMEARKGMNLFMNVKSCDCGKARFNWGGE